MKTRSGKSTKTAKATEDDDGGELLVMQDVSGNDMGQILIDFDEDPPSATKEQLRQSIRKLENECQVLVSKKNVEKTGAMDRALKIAELRKKIAEREAQMRIQQEEREEVECISRGGSTGQDAAAREAQIQTPATKPGDGVAQDDPLHDDSAVPATLPEHFQVSFVWNEGYKKGPKVVFTPSRTRIRSGASAAQPHGSVATKAHMKGKNQEQQKVEEVHPPNKKKLQSKEKVANLVTDIDDQSKEEKWNKVGVQKAKREEIGEKMLSSQLRTRKPGYVPPALCQPVPHQSAPPGFTSVPVMAPPPPPPPPPTLVQPIGKPKRKLDQLSLEHENASSGKRATVMSNCGPYEESLHTISNRWSLNHQKSVVQGVAMDSIVAEGSKLMPISREQQENIVEKLNLLNQKTAALKELDNKLSTHMALSTDVNSPRVDNAGGITMPEDILENMKQRFGEIWAGTEFADKVPDMVHIGIIQQIVEGTKHEQAGLKKTEQHGLSDKETTKVPEKARQELKSAETIREKKIEEDLKIPSSTLSPEARAVTTNAKTSNSAQKDGVAENGSIRSKEKSTEAPEPKLSCKGLRIEFHRSALVPTVTLGHEECSGDQVYKESAMAFIPHMFGMPRGLPANSWPRYAIVGWQLVEPIVSAGLKAQDVAEIALSHTNNDVHTVLLWMGLSYIHSYLKENSNPPHHWYEFIKAQLQKPMRKKKNSLSIAKSPLLTLCQVLSRGTIPQKFQVTDTNGSYHAYLIASLRMLRGFHPDEIGKKLPKRILRSLAFLQDGSRKILSAPVQSKEEIEMQSAAILDLLLHQLHILSCFTYVTVLSGRQDPNIAMTIQQRKVQSITSQLTDTMDTLASFPDMVNIFWGSVAQLLLGNGVPGVVFYNAGFKYHAEDITRWPWQLNIHQHKLSSETTKAMGLAAKNALNLGVKILRKKYNGKSFDESSASLRALGTCSLILNSNMASSQQQHLGQIASTSSPVHAFEKLFASVQEPQNPIEWPIGMFQAPLPSPLPESVLQYCVSVKPLKRQPYQPSTFHNVIQDTIPSISSAEDLKHVLDLSVSNMGTDPEGAEIVVSLLERAVALGMVHGVPFCGALKVVDRNTDLSYFISTATNSLRYAKPAAPPALWSRVFSIISSFSPTQAQAYIAEVLPELPDIHQFLILLQGEA